MKLDIQKMVVSSAIEAIVLTVILVYGTPMIVPLLGGIAAPISAALTLAYGITLFIAVALKNVAYAYVIPKKYQ